MSDDHNKSDPEMDGSEVVHTEFDDWKPYLMAQISITEEFM